LAIGWTVFNEAGQERYPVFQIPGLIMARTFLARTYVSAITDFPDELKQVGIFLGKRGGRR
jgi:hypothetical protein